MSLKNTNKRQVLFAICCVLALVFGLERVGSAAGWSTGASLSAGRYNHTATLLPDGRVLVSGGTYDGTNFLASAEVYDPASDTWSGAENMSIARGNHTATLLSDGRVLVAGGYDGSTYHNSAEIFDPVSGSWSTDGIGNMSIARGNHTATLLPDGQVLIAGGYDGSAYHSSAELFSSTDDTFSATGDLNAGRNLHTATLLQGGTVLVAGGENGSALNTSEIYDPSGGTWSATTGSLNAARYHHTATLLNNGIVLVSGGSNGTDNLISAELYDPAAGTWTGTATSMAVAHSQHSASLLPDGSVVVVGGNDNGSGYLPDAEVYDSTTGNWAGIGSLETARTFHTATLLPDGRLLLAGGSNGAEVSSAEIYDPSVHSWNTAAEIAGGRYGHRATILSDGGVMIVGGFNGSAHLATAEIYDSVTDMWTGATNMVSARYYPSVILLHDGTVLVAGGRTNGLSYLTSAERYNPDTGTWSSAGDMASSRFYHTATLLADGRVLVTGGQNGTDYLSSAEIYNPFTNTWSSAGDMAEARYGHSATLLADGRVLVAGGLFDNGLGVQTIYYSAEIYDPVTNTWDDAGNMTVGATNYPRYDHAATLLSDGTVLVVGGSNGSAPKPNAILYDPEGDTWSSAGDMSVGRKDHTATLLPDGRVLVAGGNNGAVWLSAAELYSPSAGTWSSAGSMNTARGRHTTTLLHNGRVLVSGGVNSSYPLQTEVFDVGQGYDEAWQPSIASVPSPLFLNSSITINGDGFRGYGNTEAAGGGTNSSNTNFPLVQLRSENNGKVLWLSPQSFTATDYTAEPVTDFPLGSARMIVYVNGIPSNMKYVLVTTTYSVEATAGANGYLDGGTPSPQIMNQGSTTDFTFHADANYHVASVSGCGINYVNTDNAVVSRTETTETILADCLVSATFAINTYTVNSSVSGGNGTIAPLGDQVVNYNATPSYTLTPADGYHIAAVSGTCGGTLTGTTFTTNGVQDNCTVVASFAINQYTVSATAGSNGYLDGGTPSPQTVIHGSTVDFTFHADANYHVASISGCGINYVNTDNAVKSMAETTPPLIGDCLVSAAFAIDAYQLSVTVNGKGSGSIVSDPAAIFCPDDCVQRFDYNTTVTLTAAPEAGSLFTGWSGDCAGRELDCTLMMDQDRDVTVDFGKFPWHLFLPAFAGKNVP